MVKSHEALIYKVCIAFATQYGSTVEDLKQEILCNLWHGFGGFRHQCAESTWIYRVALNTALMRRRKERHRLELTSLESIPYHPEPSTDLDVVEQRQLNRLYALIARLDKEEQKIIYLYLDRLSLKEIAEVLDISEGNVKIRIHRIKTKMKGMAQDEED